MTLTQAGIDRGFQLSIFATRFPDWPGLSPLSALVESAGVLVTSFTGEVRLFATDTDHQYASDAALGMSIPYSNTMCLALLNGSIYMAQQDYGDVVLLNPNGSFGGGGSIVTRDDRTSPNTTPYSAFTLSAPGVTALSAQNAQFDLTGFGGVVALGNMLRTGQLGWNTGDRFDLAFGVKSTVSSGPVSYGPMMWQVQNSASDPAPYTYGWDLPPGFLADTSSGLGGIYQVGLIDAVGSGGSPYTLTDRPEQNWPGFYGKNVLSLVVNAGANPTLEQGRCLDMVLSYNDTVQNGTWEILLNQTVLLNQAVIASSVQPQGWSVEGDSSGYNGVWVGAPSSATVGIAYEVRCAHRHAAGFFDVIAGGSTGRAAVLRPLSVGANPLVGGNSTLTLDAPAPVGGATVSLLSSTPGVGVPVSVTIPAGATSATFTITSAAIASISSGTLLASYNGVRQIPLYVVPAVGTVVYDINSGGPTVSPFAADVDFSGGSAFGTTSTIDLFGATNPAPLTVYQTRRTGSFSYSLPGLLPGASYTVRLHFAELLCTASGQRSITATINGANVLSGFDVFAAAGGAFKAVVRDFNAVADAGGRLNLVFSATGAQPALCSGIEVLTAVSGAPPSALACSCAMK